MMSLSRRLRSTGDAQATVQTQGCLQHATSRLYGARVRLKRCKRRGRSPVIVRAASEDNNVGFGDEDNVNIDALAKRLSEEAEKLRRSESGKEATTSSSLSSATDEDPVFGPQATQRQRDFLARTEGGFVANEFEILQQLGRLSWVTEGAKEDPLQMAATTTEQVQAVVAFAARYFSGGPFQDPVTTFLKEFLPVAKPVGYNELQIATTLSGLPEMKWQAAAAGLSPDPPVVPILGYFMARQSDTGTLLSQEDMQVSDSPEALWLVYKWESLQPLSFYAAAEQPGPRAGFLWGGDPASEALRARCRMLRQIARGLLTAVAFCHERGVGHGSLGAGSVLVSTFDDRRADQLIVKLTNFGFARQHSALQQPSLDAGLLEWQKDDLQAIAIILLEAIFSALAEGGPSQATSADALKRLLVEVFAGDIDRFRTHLDHEIDWMAPAALLDQFGSAGWSLISGLMSGQNSAAHLLASNPFVSLETQ